VSTRNELIDRLAGFQKQLADIEAEVDEKARPHEEAIAALNNEYGEMIELLETAIDETRRDILEAMEQSGDKRAAWAGLEVLVQSRKQVVVEDYVALREHLHYEGILDDYTSIDLPKLKRERGSNLPGMVEKVKPVLVVK
jgi:hypothetical protein